MARLQLKQLQKTYPNGYHAIHSANLDVASGEFVVIVGPSGCGKSTLLRMVAGLESISGGDLMLADERVNDKSPSERDIAMVFQNYALYPHMSVFDNMAYGLKIRKLSKEEIKKRVEDTAQILGLTDLLKRKPKQLSGGQRQRVAMGRAIVRQPKLFLFDEPLSNLDAKLRVQMRLEMQAIHNRLGITSLYVTHDQVEAMTLAQRIVILNKGHIEQVGTPDEIYNQPASTFVAEFIGSPPMNLLPVTVLADGWQLTDAKLPNEKLPNNKLPESKLPNEKLPSATGQKGADASASSPDNLSVAQYSTQSSTQSIAQSSTQTSQQPFNITNAEALTQHGKRFGIDAQNTQSQSTVWLGIRPERISISLSIDKLITDKLSTDKPSTKKSMPQGANDDQVSIIGRIKVVERLGAEVLVYASVANQTMIVRRASEEFARLGLQVGDACRLSFACADVYWFDNDTGKAMHHKVTKN